MPIFPAAVLIQPMERPQQQVHPGLRQLGPGFDLRQQRTREHPRLANPVGLVDDAQDQMKGVPRHQMTG